MNYSLILDAGSRPGPASYTFPVNVTGSVPGAMNGFQWESCVPVGARSRSTGQPYSDPTQADKTNFPTCTVTGSGANYSVTASDLTYTLVNTPVNDSMGSPLPGSGAYIASGTIEFSIPAPVTVLTTYTFSAAGAPPFTFTDNVTSPDPQTNNVSSATLRHRAASATTGPERPQIPVPPGTRTSGSAPAPARTCPCRSRAWTPGKNWRQHPTPGSTSTCGCTCRPTAPFGTPTSVPVGHKWRAYAR
ncbi:hypothetical protein ACW0JT_05605 [Arthrobacter sp. SA17]